MAQEEVLSALRVVGPMSTKDLAAYLGLVPSGIRTSLRRLRPGVRICRYEANVVPRGPWVPIYEIGDAPDLPPPYKRKTKRSETGKELKRLRERVRPATPWDALL